MTWGTPAILQRLSGDGKNSSDTGTGGGLYRASTGGMVPLSCGYRRVHEGIWHRYSWKEGHG